MNRFVVTILALVYAGYVLVLTLHPFQFSWSDLPSFREGLAVFFAGPGRTDIVVNILLFVPFGYLLYCRAVLTRKVRSAILVSVLVGGVFSLIIELLQILTVRHSSFYDVISNALGSGTGALVAVLLPPRAAEFFGRLWARVEEYGLALIMSLLYGAVPLVLSFVQLRTPFAVWNSRFSFQIGNEATLDRPWLGRIYLVGVHERALSEHEVRKRFREGVVPGASNNPRRDALIALYTFTEGRGRLVHDKSGFESPLNLELLPGSHVRWLDSNGIELVRPAVLKSREPATKLVKTLSAAHELSIEVWLAPNRVVQNGPARIVSLSRNPSMRNFTLEQEGSEIEFRLRTPVSDVVPAGGSPPRRWQRLGRNGPPLTVKSTDEIAAFEKSHVVATYKNGVEKLYINGKQQLDVLNLTRDGIIGFGTRRTPLAAFAYSFFYFFPVSFFCAAFLSRRANVVIALSSAVATGAGLVVGTEIFQMLAFARTLDIWPLAFGTLVSGVGALGGRMFVTK